LLAFEPGVNEVLCDAVGSPVNFTPSKTPITMDQAIFIRNLIGNTLPNVGVVPITHGKTPSCGDAPRRR
jgi:hypothetical protein